MGFEGSNRRKSSDDGRRMEMVVSSVLEQSVRPQMFDRPSRLTNYVNSVNIS